MKTRVDPQLLDEATRFAFRFSCDDCAHFHAAAARCSLAYPAAPRRDALAGTPVPGSSTEGGPHLELCKEFELD